MAPPTRPRVVTWFKVYAWVLVALYVFCIAFGAFLPFMPDEVVTEDGYPPEMKYVYAVVFIVVGLGCLAAALASIFLPSKPKVWILDLVLLLLGMTSICFIPFCLPMVIFWQKPEVRQWFGRR